MRFKSVVNGLSLEDGREVAYGEVFESDNPEWLQSAWVEALDKDKDEDKDHASKKMNKREPAPSGNSVREPAPVAPEDAPNVHIVRPAAATASSDVNP